MDATTSTSDNNSPLLKSLPDALFYTMADFLDEKALSSLATVCTQIQSYVSQAWIRLAVRRCHATASVGDGTKGFPSAAVARTFLQARHERIRVDSFCCAHSSCTHTGILRCSKCKVAMYCCRYVRKQDDGMMRFSLIRFF
jgi:hypothetical protein